MAVNWWWCGGEVVVRSEEVVRWRGVVMECKVG